MDIFCYAIKSEKEILTELRTQKSSGLTSIEAKNRRRQYGSNVLDVREVKWWQVLLRQFKSAFVYLLFAAVLITFLLKEYIDSLMILFFLLINACLGFFQEYRSEKTIQFLKRYVVSYVKVRRDNKQVVIKSEELVPGDILILKTGDKILADVRFLKTENLRVDESILTGESAPVNKQAEILRGAITSYYQALNLGFSGTIVVDGEAESIVLATGKQSAIGRIAKIAGEVKRISNFERGISQFADLIMKIVGLMLLIIFFVSIIIKKGHFDIVELIIFFIALTVGIIPEALPVVTVCSLSRGARRLAKQKIIVKRLSAVEDLGSIQVLCSDKTGTLTENKLTVADIKGRNRQAVLFYANLAGIFKQDKKLEPFDIALWQEIKELEKEKIWLCDKIVEVPFNPKTRRNICLVDNGQRKELITRGAPETIFDLCSSLSKKERQDFENWIVGEGFQGRRVLAVAKKTVYSEHTERELRLEQERDFEFLGVISFVDNIKESAFKVVKRANQLGVKIKIITGDSREVAGAVAYQIGIIQKPEDVITADQWEELNDEDKNIVLDKYAVFARVSPEQKYEIVRMMQKKYEVGFLGEGINDAPVLKIASVALVVDSAADIARESADIILLKRSLLTIVDGIAEGRKVFANVTKYIKITLTSNFGNFFAVATASLLIDFLPMLPLQILLLNLLSDFPMIAIATDTVDGDELISPRKYEVKEIAVFSTFAGLLSTCFDFIFFVLFFRLGPGVLRTNWFIASVLTELILLFSLRTRLFFTKAKFPSVVLVCLSFFAFVVAIGLPFVVYGQRFFSFIPPTIQQMVLILGLVCLYFISNEILKAVYYKKYHKILNN